MKTSAASPKDIVPFNKPPLLGGELDAIRQCLGEGTFSGNGRFSRQCARLLEERLPVARALITPSCTAALEMAAILCDLGPGDEAIVPSFTFSSTANAIALRGAVPVFVDIEPDTLNLSPDAVEQAITGRTRAIFVVHYAGVPCEMDRINEIAAAHGLVVIEDAAQALGSTYRGRAAGALASMAAFSFHATKNIVSGEGGALTLGDPALVERAEIVQEKGTNRSQFVRGEVDKYTWVDIGSSYLLSEIAAAFLIGQVRSVDEINAGRLATWQTYRDSFLDLEKSGRVRLPFVPEHVRHNAHIFYLLLRDEAERDRFLEAMRGQGVMATSHYVPLHSSPAGRKYGRGAGSLAQTDRTAGTIVRLPLYFGMSDRDRDRVIDRVRAYFSAE